MLLRPRHTPTYLLNDRQHELKPSHVVYAQGSGMDGKCCISDMACATDVIDDEGASTGSDERGAFANLGEPQQPPPRKRRSSDGKHMRMEASDATAHKRRRSNGAQDARSRHGNIIAARGLSPAEEEAVACLDEFAAFASKYKHQFADADEAEAVYGMVSLTHAKHHAERQRQRQRLRGRQVSVTPPLRRQQLQEAEGTTPDGEDASHATHSMHGTDPAHSGESDGDQSGTEDASDHSGKSTPTARQRHGKQQAATQQQQQHQPQQQAQAVGPGMMVMMPQGMMAPAMGGMPSAMPAFAFMPPGLHPGVMPLPPFLGMGMPPWAFPPSMMFGGMGPMMMGAAPGCLPTSVPAMVMGCPAPTVPAAATPAAGAPGQLSPAMMHMHHMAMPMHMVPPFMMPAMMQSRAAPAGGIASAPAQASAAAQPGGAAAAGAGQAQPVNDHQQQGSGAVQQRAGGIVAAIGQAPAANGSAPTAHGGNVVAANGSHMQATVTNSLPSPAASSAPATAASAVPTAAATTTTMPGLGQKGCMTYPLPWMMVGGPNGMSPLQQQQHLVHAQAAMALQQQQLMQYHAQQQALAQQQQLQQAHVQPLGTPLQQQQAQQRQQATAALQQFQRQAQQQAPAAAMGVPVMAVKQEPATGTALPRALPQLAAQPAVTGQAAPASAPTAAAKAGSLLLLGQQLQQSAAMSAPVAIGSLPALGSTASAVKQ